MDKTVYIQKKEIKLFNIKVAEVTEKYEQCDRTNFEPLEYNLLMQLETKLQD